MIELKQVNKVYDKTILNNIDLSIDRGESVVITGNSNESNNVLIKLLAGIYKIDSGTYLFNNKEVNSINDSYFYLPSTISYNDFNTVDDLINYYALYYKSFDKVTIGHMLNSVNFSKETTLSTCTYSEVKMLYLIIAIHCGAIFLFIEDLFLSVDENIKIKMKELILKSQSSRSFIMSSNSINEFHELIDSIVFINNSNVFKFNLEYFDSFYKYSVVYETRVEEAQFSKYNPIYLKVYRRNIIIILKHDSNLFNNFIRETTPILYDRLPLDLHDIFYCIEGECK